MAEPWKPVLPYFYKERCEQENALILHQKWVYAPKEGLTARFIFVRAGGSREPLSAVLLPVTFVEIFSYSTKL